MKKFNKIKPFRKAENIFLRQENQKAEKFVSSPFKKSRIRSGSQQVSESEISPRVNRLKKRVASTRKRAA
jgi:hypothetical protein